ncbi:MAG: hypothetical protein AB1631_30085 [Acidobacteriota bacterium]
MERSTKARRLHSIIGLTMLLPFFGWALTGFVFYIKPGYAQAYESLQPRLYPLADSPQVKPDPAWLEFRLVKTALGDHLLARTQDGWMHLDPATMRLRDQPTEEEIRRLVTDAFSINPQRYGQIERIEDKTVFTTTGVRVNIDWNRLSLQQRGRDTDRIDLLYRIHYLQWTGIAAIDKTIGPAGLILVILLAILGVRLAVTSRREAT